MLIFFDGELQFAGSERQYIMSDTSWELETPDGDKRVPETEPSVTIGMSGTVADPASYHVRRRPCTLPGFEWLEDGQGVKPTLDMTMDAAFGAVEEEWLAWEIPSAASKVCLPINGNGRLEIDGKPCGIVNGVAALPETSEDKYRAVLYVQPDAGSTGGALLRGPVEYETSLGTMEAGDWMEKGLASWSGGVRYMRDVQLPEREAGRLLLDLGKVRGTAEIRINGKDAGYRFLSPYRFDITEYIVPGRNRIEICVFNTIANYLKAHSDTQYAPDVQLPSGLFGPVRILSCP